MNIVVFLCFVLAAGCFAATALNVSTRTNLVAVGWLALTVGLALALHVWSL